MYSLKSFIVKLSEHLKKYHKLEDIIYQLVKYYNILPCIGVEIEFNLSENIDILEFESLLGEKIKKEKGRRQYEIAFKPSVNIISYIENICCIKSKIQTIAKTLNGRVNFAAKDSAYDYGNSMHLHINFFDASSYSQDFFFNQDHSIKKLKFDFFNKSVFLENHLSSKKFYDDMANSVCHYMKSTLLVFNSYKEDYLRYDKDFMAPTHISFGNNNRTVALRIPDSFPRRLEHRIASPTTDLYIAIFTILKSILLGLKYPKNIIFIKKTYGNAYDTQYDLDPLPRTFQEALEKFNLDFFLRNSDKNFNFFKLILDRMT